MNILMITLRIVHVFSGVFWVGVSIFNISFLQPTIQSTGSEGQTVMQHLTRHTRFTVTIYTAANLTLLSGLAMYWIIFRFRLSALSSGYGLVLTIGSLAGIVAWVIAMFFIRRIISQMQAIGKAIQEQGSPPSPDQAEGLQSSSGRLITMGQWGLAFMVVSLLGMSIAQYVSL